MAVVVVVVVVVTAGAEVVAVAVVEAAGRVVAGADDDEDTDGDCSWSLGAAPLLVDALFCDGGCCGVASLAASLLFTEVFCCC